MNFKIISKKDIYICVFACLTTLMCTEGFSAFKEVSIGGDVIQSSTNSQDAKTISHASEKINIRAPQQSSTLWSDISETTRYQSIGNESVQAKTLEENTRLRSEIAELQTRLNNVEHAVSALEIKVMPGEAMLTRSLK